MLSTEAGRGDVLRYRLRTILDGAVESLGLAGAAAFVWNPDAERLKVVASIEDNGAERYPEGSLLNSTEDDLFYRLLDDQTTDYKKTSDGIALVLKVDGRNIGVLAAWSHPNGQHPETCLKSLSIFAEQAAFALDSARVESRREAETRREYSLYEASRSISAAHRPDEILGLLAELLAHGVGAEKAVVFKRNSETGEYLPRFTFPEGLLVEPAHPIILEDSPLYNQLRDGHCIVFPEAGMESSQISREVLNQIGLVIGRQPGVLAPVVSRRKLLAVAAVACPFPVLEFTSREIELLGAIAYQAAVAVENAKLLENQQRTVTELAALYAVAQALVATLGLDERLRIIAESIAAVTGVSRCGIFLVEDGAAIGELVIGASDEETREFKRLRIDLTQKNTTLMQAVKNGKPSVVEQTATRTEAYLGSRWRVVNLLLVPLVSEGRTVGIAVADEPGRSSRFSADAQRVSAAIAEQAALSIHYSRLFEQTRQYASNLHSLWEVGQALGRELEIDEILDRFLDEVGKLPMARAAAAALRNPDGSILVMRRPGDKTTYRDTSAVTHPFARVCLKGMENTSYTLVHSVPLDIHRHGAKRARKGLCTVLCVPILQAGITTGVMAVAAENLHEFTKSEIGLIGSMCSVASAAINRATLFEREKRIAETLQRSFLPDAPARVGQFDIASYYRTASQEATIGGDFYDVFTLDDNRLVVVIGDVSGKGLSAAVHTAMTKYLLRAYAFEEGDPGRILAKVNDAACHYTPAAVFVTLFMAILNIETGEVVYSNAGHEFPLMWKEAVGRIVGLASTGRALGFSPGCNYLTEKIAMDSGDVLLLFTDGLTEARVGSGFLNTASIREMLASVKGSSVTEITGKLEEMLLSQKDLVITDDVACLVVKRSDENGN